MLKIDENYEVMEGKVYTPTDLANAAFLDADGLVNEGYTGTGAAPLQILMVLNLMLMEQQKLVDIVDVITEKILMEIL